MVRVDKELVQAIFSKDKIIRDDYSDYSCVFCLPKRMTTLSPL